MHTYLLQKILEDLGKINKNKRKTYLFFLKGKLKHKSQTRILKCRILSLDTHSRCKGMNVRCVNLVRYRQEEVGRGEFS